MSVPLTPDPSRTLALGCSTVVSSCPSPSLPQRGPSLERWFACWHHPRCDPEQRTPGCGNGGQDRRALTGHQPLGRKENTADLISQRRHPPAPPSLLLAVLTQLLPSSSFHPSALPCLEDKWTPGGRLPYWCLPQPPPTCGQTPGHVRLSQVQSQQRVSLHRTDCVLGCK